MKAQLGAEWIDFKAKLNEMDDLKPIYLTHEKYKVQYFEELSEKAKFLLISVINIYEAMR